MRQSRYWWLLLPALAACIWLAIWLQWYLPGEDQWGIEIVFAAIAIGGFAVGVGFAATRRLFWIIIALPALWPPHVPLDAFLWAWLLIVIRAGGLGLFATLGVTAVRARPGPWHLPVAVALVLIAVTLETAWRLDDSKTFWPWSAHRQELIALRRNATDAAHRLGLRTSLTPFDDETGRRLAAAVPIETTFEFPLIHRRVTARIIDTDSGFVSIVFHDGRIGSLDPETMRLWWVSD